VTGVKARVSALVVTWNSGRPLRGLLPTLDPAEVAEIVQVDNASADDSLEIARSWPGPLRQVRNDENVGFASALRQAVAEARGEYLLVVNPDVRFADGGVSLLAQRLDGDGEIVAVGPKLLGDDGAVQPFCARRLPGVRESAIEAFGLRRFVQGTRLDPYTFPRAAYDIERDVPCLSGAAMLVRRNALERAGGIDARWFMYFEDIDLCARLARVGRIRYCPAAVARHEGAASSPRTPQLETWLAVHLAAAVNLFLRIHSGTGAAFAQRMFVGVNGLARLAAIPLLLAASPSRAAVNARRGAALLRWAFGGAAAGSPR
jgi:GT2 family glycosyltransferase